MVGCLDVQVGQSEVGPVIGGRMDECRWPTGPPEPSMSPVPWRESMFPPNRRKPSLFTGGGRVYPDGHRLGTLEVGKVCPPIARKELFLHCCRNSDVDWRRVWGPADYIHTTSSRTAPSCPTATIS